MKRTTCALRCAALMLALALLFSTAAFASSSGFAEKLNQMIASAPAATKSNVWNYNNSAAAKQSAGNYRGAISDYASALRFFAANGSVNDNNVNEIHAYRHIAECYGALGEYGMASAAWRTAAARCETLIRTAPSPLINVNDQTTCERNAAALDTVTELYCKSADPARGSGSYFGAPGEPVNGFVPGVYAEADAAVHDANGSKRYWNDFPAVTGVDADVYMLYLDYGMPLSHYESHIRAAREKGFAIELSLQPRSGLSAVQAGDPYLVQFAKDIEDSGVQFYLRFAGEMNDASGGNSWYTADTAAFIRAFRAFASVIHSYAPSAAVVWAPNSFPGYNIPDYYPGDEYVDIVGISLYMSYRPELNPLGNGVENRRWIDEIDTIYALYGARKPIMVTEGAVSLATAGGLDLSSFAAAQLQDFFLYLPIRYPNVKFMVWFDAADTVGNDVYRCLTSNATVLRAYRAALTGNKSVLSSVKAAAAPVYYGRLLTGSGVADGPVTLCTYVKGVTPIARVSYAVNGVALGTCTTAPYEITADFSAYRGTRVRVTVSSYYADGTQAGEDGFTLCVEGMAPSGTAYAREQTVILDGKPVTLSAYAVKNAKGYETNYVSVRELATTLRGTPGQYDVVWNKAAKVISITTGRTYSAADETPLTGDRTYCVNPAQTLINGTVENLSSIVIKDWQGGGHCYYKLRDLGEALGIEVVWSHGIYINTAAQ